jgi:menaquinone-dependent protoporphyrinogen oxidase
MAAYVLVAYGTKMGSNAQIAEAIAAVLREAGLEVTTLPAREARDLAPYDAVVLGSALYAAHWQREAHRFVTRGREALRTRRLWLWSSGPLDHHLASMDLPPAENVLAIMADVPFRAHRTFGGLLDPSSPGVDEQILRTHPVGDFRDWQRIRAYAQEIAEELTAG